MIAALERLLPLWTEPVDGRDDPETGKPQCCHSRGSSALSSVPSRSVFMLAA